MRLKNGHPVHLAHGSCGSNDPDMPDRMFTEMRSVYGRNLVGIEFTISDRIDLEFLTERLGCSALWLKSIPNQ